MLVDGIMALQDTVNVQKATAKMEMGAIEETLMTTVMETCQPLHDLFYSLSPVMAALLGNHPSTIDKPRGLGTIIDGHLSKPYTPNDVDAKDDTTDSALSKVMNHIMDAASHTSSSMSSAMPSNEGMFTMTKACCTTASFVFAHMLYSCSSLVYTM
jgi:hypothetical protein